MVLEGFKEGYSGVSLGKLNFNLKTPKRMPAQIVQRIEDLKCPPPILPSQQTAEINELNNQMLKQASEIDILEKLIEDLEKRYRISFTCNPEVKYDLKSTQLPRVDISGNLTNVYLEFHLWESRKGIKGIKGYQGDQGKQGETAPSGKQGPTGYYGVRGDIKK